MPLLPLLAAANIPPLPIGFCIVVGTMAVASVIVEYLYARFGESNDICWRFSMVAVVLGMLHIFWHAWTQQLDVVGASLAPENTVFRLRMLAFIAVTWLLPAWLISNAAKFTWCDRFVPRGTGLVVFRTALCVGLAVALIWLGDDILSLLPGARFLP